MNVIAHDMYENPSPDFVKYVDMDTPLARSDLISLHCPLTDDTKHMINNEIIHKMKDCVISVNTPPRRTDQYRRTGTGHS